MALTDYKIPVFSGINDVPKAPTSQQGGNGSHLISKFNGLCDDLAGQEFYLNSRIVWDDAHNHQWEFAKCGNVQFDIASHEIHLHTLSNPISDGEISAFLRTDSSLIRGKGEAVKFRYTFTSSTTLGVTWRLVPSPNVYANQIQRLDMENKLFFISQKQGETATIVTLADLWSDEVGTWSDPVQNQLSVPVTAGAWTFSVVLLSQGNDTDCPASASILNFGFYYP